MSKFHSTISRRDFMKGLGLAGAGLGTAAASVPVFHDLDELKQQGTHPYKSWWVKERNYGDIVHEVDWSVWEPYSPVKHPMHVSMAGSQKMMSVINDNIDNNVPGNTLRDYGLFAAGGFMPIDPPWDGPPASQFSGLYMGNMKWNESPEENLTTARSALHFFGTPNVGAMEVNENMKKLLNDGTTVFDDSDAGWKDDDGIFHIPNKCRWIIVWTTKQNAVQTTFGLVDDPNDAKKYKEMAWLGQSSVGQAYSHAYQIRHSFTGFLNCLGYQALKPPANATVPFAVFTGLGEQGRNTNLCGTNHGLGIRYTDYAFTDFPVAPTKPIDAGILEFCKACKRCAEVCPSESIMMDDEPTWEALDPGNHPGYKGWRMNWTSCIDFGSPVLCVNCQGVCPLNHVDESSIHTFVRAALANTDVFNGFFANMDKMFGYGKPRGDEALVDWWNRDLSKWKYDSLLGFGSSVW